MNTSDIQGLIDIIDGVGYANPKKGDIVGYKGRLYVFVEGNEDGACKLYGLEMTQLYDDVYVAERYVSKSEIAAPPVLENNINMIGRLAKLQQEVKAGIDIVAFKV